MPQSNSRPVLRWITSASSTPPSPDLHSLSEALSESLPPLARPPLARLPPSFRPSRHFARPPPFLVDNLTRSTLPTSSLSPPLPVTSATPPRDVQKPPPIVLGHSSLTQSSVDSLRSVHRRTSTTRTVSGSSSRSVSSTSTSAFSILAPPQHDENDSAAQSAPTASWWWFQLNSSTKDALLEHEDQATSAQEQQETLKRKYKATRNPVVFCHGLLGFDSVTIGPAIAPLEVTHWRGIKEVLEANGVEVLITRVPATSSPIDRAKVLEQKISSVYPGRSVHLIGHSMGGLDCRYLTTHLTHRNFSVLSVTTIATPHRGSSFADHFLHTVGKHRLPQFLSLLDLLPNGGGDGQAFEFLTLESMKKFNEDTPDVEGVKYFSWGAVYEPGLIDTWKWPHSVILEKEGPNDGLVSIESAKWGTYLGTLSGVNHLDLVGWINTARYKWAEITGKEIKFRPATFYSGIVDMLAREVEGQTDDDGDSNGNGNDGQAEARPVEAAQRGSGTATPVSSETVRQQPAASEGDAKSGPATPRAEAVDQSAVSNTPIQRLTQEPEQMEPQEQHAGKIQEEMVENLDVADARPGSPPPEHADASLEPPIGKEQEGSEQQDRDDLSRRMGTSS